jgi:hypothetical protein
MSFITDMFNTAVNSFEDVQKARKEADRIGHQHKMRGVAALVGGVALAILGALLCAAGPVGAGFGVPLLLTSLPLLYLGSNEYNLGKNIQDLSQTKATDAFKIDEVYLKRKLSKNTFCYDWRVDRMVTQIMGKHTPIRN